MKKQYAPRFRAVLVGLFSGFSEIDITNWLGDNCQIRTSKGIFDPMGSFTITFLDKRMDADSVYARLFPMDGIKIWAAHDGAKDMKCIMRGFVSDIHRDETMGDDGRPVRRVTVTGHDVGKLWITQSLYFLPIPKDAKDLMTSYGIYERFLGTSPKAMPGRRFLASVVGYVLLPQLLKLDQDAKLGLSLASAGESEGDVPAQLIQHLQDISLYQFLYSLLDCGAFNELWMDDPGDGAVDVRWRPLWSGPDGITITTDEMQSISVWRNDAKVSNWFWAFPRATSIISHTQAYIETMRADTLPDARDYKWCAERFFGLRKMEVNYSLAPPGWIANADVVPEQQYVEGEISMTEWIKRRCVKLKDLNKDNSRLESCTIRFCGNEEARPGRWITVKKGDTTYRYYATKIEHEINLWQSFTTTMHGERGEKISGQATYIPELDLKGAMR